MFFPSDSPDVLAVFIKKHLYLSELRHYLFHILIFHLLEGRASQVAQMVKHLPAMWKTGLIPESGRSSGEGNGNPLQHSCLEISMDGGAWQAVVHGAAESNTTERLHFLFKNFSIIPLVYLLMPQCYTINRGCALW